MTRSKHTPPENQAALLALFVEFSADVEAFRSGTAPVVVQGDALTIPAITALARFDATPVVLSSDPDVCGRVDTAQRLMQAKVDRNVVIYGVNTGVGGSSDTRTGNISSLGVSLLQLQLAGILPVSSERRTAAAPSLPAPQHPNVMPESWVRAATLVRANALARGHSGVRIDLIEHLLRLLRANITPLVPIRGSISASGDLQPLSYVAATLIGSPAVRVYAGRDRAVVPASRALASHAISPISLVAKEHLGLLNGTSFSAAVGALVLHDTLQLAVLAQVLTALGTEALLGSRASFYRFIHDTCRPHPGQIEVAQTVLWLLHGSKFATGRDDGDIPLLDNEEAAQECDAGLKQDRYALRTSPQFLGPQLEDILSAIKTVQIECNSSTDNPLIDPATSRIHQGGNFQAMSVTSAMEKTRLSLFHTGKILFAQATEICNPATNNGLPPSVAATDPSLNFHAKGLDIAGAAYVGELGWLAGPVGVHAQSAEMHNQSVNSLALISARATTQAVDVLSMLMASYLYILCQALDLRALQAEYATVLHTIVTTELAAHSLPATASPVVHEAVRSALARTSTLDAAPRMEAVAAACATPLIAHLTHACPSFPGVLERIVAFQEGLATRGTTALLDLRTTFLSGARGAAPAAAYLGRTRTVYTYVRETLGVCMHGRGNLALGECKSEAEAMNLLMQETVGDDVSVVYEAIKGGEFGVLLADVFKGSNLFV